MSENGMIKNKSKMIADLYALRAGLSVISEQTDAIRAQEANSLFASKGVIDVENNIKGIEKGIKNLQNEKEYLQNQEQQAQADYDKFVLERASGVYRSEKSLETISKIVEGRSIKFPNNFWTPKCIFFFVLSFVVTFVVQIIIMAIASKIEVDESNPDSNSVRLLLSMFLFFLLYLLPLVVLIVRRINSKKEYEKYWQSIYDAAEKSLKTEIAFCAGGKIGQVKTLIKARKVELVDEKRKLKEEESKRDLQLQKNAETVRQIAKGAKCVKDSLNKVYDSWLSESDWGNVDLLIYYLETGRADTLKEALQLVDRQRQTDQIVEAIEEAGEAICATIYTASQRLGQALAQSFSVISAQLSKLGTKLDGINVTLQENNMANRDLQKSIETGLQNIEKGISSQVTATTLANALLAKSEMTSEQLLNDLRYGQSFWMK